MLSGRFARRSTFAASLFSGAAAFALFLCGYPGVNCDLMLGYSATVCSLRELERQSTQAYLQHHNAVAALTAVSFALATPALLSFALARSIALLPLHLPTLRDRLTDLMWSLWAGRVFALRHLNNLVCGFAVQLAVFLALALYLPGDGFLGFGPAFVADFLFPDCKPGFNPYLRMDVSCPMGPSDILFPPAAFCQASRGLVRCSLNANVYLPLVYACLWFLMAFNLLAHALTIAAALVLFPWSHLRYAALRLEAPTLSSPDFLARLSARLNFSQYIIVHILCDLCDPPALEGLLDLVDFSI